MTEENSKPLNKDSYQEYEQDHWRARREKISKGIRKSCYSRTNRISENHVIKFMSDRVKKLAELYDEHEPAFTTVRVHDDPKNSRSWALVDVNIDEGVSPFELEDFDEQMPKLIDYLGEYDD
jgi:hypothetical protein